MVSMATTTSLPFMLYAVLVCIAAVALYAGYLALRKRRVSRAQAVREALKQAAEICDGLARLYRREDVGFDTGYRMGCERAAREIRALGTKGTTNG